MQPVLSWQRSLCQTRSLSRIRNHITTVPEGHSGVRLRLLQRIGKEGLPTILACPAYSERSSDMKSAAIGVRMHSGWVVLVAVCADTNRVDVIDGGESSPWIRESPGLTSPTTMQKISSLQQELDEQAKSAFGNAASRVRRRISSLGSSIDPPWT